MNKEITIEDMKDMLNKAIELYGVCSEFTLKISQFLDLFVVEEMTKIKQHI